MITALSSHQRSYTCCLSFHHLLDALKLVSCWLPVTPPAPLAGQRPCTFPNPDVTCHPVMFHSEYLLLLQTPFFLLRRHSLSPGLLLHMWLLCPLHVISVLGLLLT